MVVGAALAAAKRGDVKVRWAVASQLRRVGRRPVEVHSVGVGWALHHAGGFICQILTPSPGDRGR